MLLGVYIPFSMQAQCDQPFDLLADSITTYSADLSWTPGGDEEYWGFEWGLDGFVLGEGNRIDSLTSPEYFLSDLEAETSYDYYVWAICVDDSSTWGALEFMTLPRNNMTCFADTLIVNNADTTYFVDNSNAVPSGPQASCWANHGDGDLWYLFELAEASGIEIFTSEVSSNDSHIALYEISGCDSDSIIYNEIACSEDSSTINWMSYIITEELSPGTYYIQCGTWTNAAGIYTIRINTTEPIVYPPNNECSGAPISNVIVGGATVSVNGDGTNASDENAMGAAHVWEAFTLDTCGDVTIDFCGSTPGPTVLFSSLHNECPVESIFQSGTQQADFCDDGNLAMNFTNIPAGTYYYPVVADDGIGGFVEYTMNITASFCVDIPQPDTCTTWLGGPWGDFNSTFGGAPEPDTNGVCEVYELNSLSIYASESYEVFNFIEGIEYSVSVCNGAGAGSWPVEIAILDTLQNIIAWEESCQLYFIAPYSGTLFIGFNEVDACGESSENTSTANGFLSISCGGVAIGVNEIIKSEFKIYPNPSNGIISLENNSASGFYSLSLISISGKVIWNEDVSLLNNQVLSLILPEVKAGLYLFRMTNINDRSYSIKRLIIK